MKRKKTVFKFIFSSFTYDRVVDVRAGLQIGPSFGKWTKWICRNLSFELELLNKIIKILLKLLGFSNKH